MADIGETDDEGMTASSKRKLKSTQQQEVEAGADDSEDDKDDNAGNNGEDQDEDECEEGAISIARQDKGKGIAVEPTTPVDTDYEIDPALEAAMAQAPAEMLESLAKVLTVDKGIFIL